MKVKEILNIKEEEIINKLSKDEYEKAYDLFDGILIRFAEAYQEAAALSNLDDDEEFVSFKEYLDWIEEGRSYLE